jgi:hypothetical protein
MKEEIKKLNPILIELDDKLEPDEIFTGISAVNNEGNTIFVGLAEKLDDLMRPITKHYVNIKAKHLKPKNDIFTKEDMKAAYENGVDKEHSFEEWFTFKYKNNE